MKRLMPTQNEEASLRAASYAMSPRAVGDSCMGNCIIYICKNMQKYVKICTAQIYVCTYVCMHVCILYILYIYYIYYIYIIYISHRHCTASGTFANTPVFFQHTTGTVSQSPADFPKVDDHQVPRKPYCLVVSTYPSPKNDGVR